MRTRKAERWRRNTRNCEAEPTHLPGSGRWHVYVWDSVARGKHWVKNPEPGSRGTWETKDEATSRPHYTQVQCVAVTP